MSDRAATRLSVIRTLPEFLAEQGYSAEPLLRRTGIVDRLQDDPNRIVTRAQICTALGTAVRLLGDEALGLRLGQRADAQHLGPSGHALIAGETIRQCLQEHARFMPSLQTAVAIDLTVRDRMAIWRHELIGSDPELVRHYYEGAAAFMVAGIRRLVGPGWSPGQVSFPHRAPADRRPYEDFFRARICFETSGPSVLAFDAAVLNAPTGRTRWHPGWPANGEISSEHDRARREVELFELSDGRLAQALEAMIDGMMMLDRVSLPAAALTLGIPVRTLQRRLAALGLSFETIVDRRRRSRADQLLADPSCRIIDVAMLLGYSDTAHFIRAFYRWHGQSPARHRRERARSGGEEVPVPL